MEELRKLEERVADREAVSLSWLHHSSLLASLSHNVEYSDKVIILEKGEGPAKDAWPLDRLSDERLTLSLLLSVAAGVGRSRERAGGVQRQAGE